VEEVMRRHKITWNPAKACRESVSS